MKKVLKLALLLLLTPFIASASGNPFLPAVGGTGSTTLGGILAGNGTAAIKSVVIGSNIQWDGTTLSATAGAGSYPFTPGTNFNVPVSSTSTVISDSAGLFASSTSQFVNLNIWSLLRLVATTSAVLYAGPDGTITSTSSSYTSSANSIVLRDANQNAFANNFVNKGTNVSAGTITLTAASTRLQTITGAGASTLTLPDATTLAVGAVYQLNNNSTGIITVNANGGGFLFNLPAGGNEWVVEISASTAPGSWDFHPWPPVVTSWGTSLLNTNTAASTTQFTATSSVWFTGITAQRPLYVDANGLVGSAGTGVSGNCVQWGANNTLADIGTTCGGASVTHVSTSSAETATRVPFWTSTNATPALLSGGNSGFTFANAGTLLTITNASTTNFTAATSLSVPNNTAPTVTSAGDVAVNTTDASSSVAYHDGTAQGNLFNATGLNFTFINYPTNGQGTSTFWRAGEIRGFTLSQGTCISLSGGTAIVNIGTGSATTTQLTAALTKTQSMTTLSSNNVFQSLQPMEVDVGTFSSSGTTTVACSLTRAFNY